MVVGERQRREDEKKRLEEVIIERRKDIGEIESDNLITKKDDERLERERNREKEISDRIAQLDAAVKTYQDKGAGGFLKEDGLKRQPSF